MGFQGSIISAYCRCIPAVKILISSRVLYEIMFIHVLIDWIGINDLKIVFVNYIYEIENNIVSKP